MNTYPILTISLLSQLTDRELQSNYLNHLDRTAEIATLLTQTTDKDLALRIVNLALEVDLSLGASLTGSINPELQKIIVDRIAKLEIPIGLKIELWRNTKSSKALPYLQHIFVIKHQSLNYWDKNETIELAISAIIEIDPNLAVVLLTEDLSNSYWCRTAAKYLAQLVPDEAIKILAPLLNDAHLTNEWNGKHFILEALDRIGTDEAINKIKVALNNRSLWSQWHYIPRLGMIAEPAMVEYLIDLLYSDKSELCCEAIAALELIGGEKVFDWFHQTMYWTSADDDFNSPFQRIVKALFKLDNDRILTSIEGAIQSYDPVVRKRAAMALTIWEVPIVDRNLSILLDAIEDPDLDIKLEIVRGIRILLNNETSEGFNPELLNNAKLATKQVLLEYAKHSDPEILDRIFFALSRIDPDERALILKLFGNIKPEKINAEYKFTSAIETSDLSILIGYLNHHLLEVRVCAAANIGKIGDDSIVPILLELIRDPEYKIREAVVKSMVDLGSTGIFPTILELANNSELLATLIWKLERPSRGEIMLPIFKEFQRNRDLTLKFLKTAEETLIKIINNQDEIIYISIHSLGRIGSNLSIMPLQQLLNLDHELYPCMEEDCVDALAEIGTDQAILAMLDFLPDYTTLGCAISRAFRYNGKLGIVPQLWSAQCKVYSDYESVTISEIQKREGLYNPDFSDRSHPLFEPPRPRLRHFLLGDCQ